MGNGSGKFRKYLRNGDEDSARSLLNSNHDVRKSLDPNTSYGEHYDHNTPLHYAAKHSMKSLLRLFLDDYGANPNKRNEANETALHCLAKGNLNDSTVGTLDTPTPTPAASAIAPSSRYFDHHRRYECGKMLLRWRGGIISSGGGGVDGGDGDVVESVNLDAVDSKKNTGLHYAAAVGNRKFVELLIANGASLFIENDDNLTPCDLAELSGHKDIALYLESKMVFTNYEDNVNELETYLTKMNDEEHETHGLCSQDLQERKDRLLIDTADMLHIQLSAAEALLSCHEWSREKLLDEWIENSEECCVRCGILSASTGESPGSATFTLIGATTSSSSSPPSPAAPAPSPPSTTTPPSATEASSSRDTEASSTTEVEQEQTECEICALDFHHEVPLSVECGHLFCRQCWKRYLCGRIECGETNQIECPAYGCPIRVPVHFIESLIDLNMSKRYLHFDIKTFVDTNPNMKWCPYADCGRAVSRPRIHLTDSSLHDEFRSSNSTSEPCEYSRAVDCGFGHVFCWECLGDPHEPCSCENWQKWFKKIAEIKPDQLHDTNDELESVANCLWLVTNSKPCPNCKSPIEKEEGCNHVKCSKCKHDFCWVCLEVWRKHSSSTGGYFRCNRFEAAGKVSRDQKSQTKCAEMRNSELQALNRFVHYYTRFKNHENSLKIEYPLLDSTKQKMQTLASAAVASNNASATSPDTSFIQNAVKQLRKARLVLKCSHVYGYYLEDGGYKKHIFEFMQTELEEVTEQLSEQVARAYLRTPRSTIIQTAGQSQRKRQELLAAIEKGLVPQDTSPISRRRLRITIDDHEELLKSMRDLDPANPWIKAPSGRHTNLSALLDWPYASDESDDDTDSPSGAANSITNAAAVAAAAATSNYTDRKINHKTRKNYKTGKNIAGPSTEDSIDGDEFNIMNDSELELQRALEMSRLQYQIDQRSNKFSTIIADEGDTSVTCQSKPDEDEQQHNEVNYEQLKLKVPAIGTKIEELRQENPATRSTREQLIMIEATTNEKLLQFLNECDTSITSKGELCETNSNGKACAPMSTDKVTRPPVLTDLCVSPTHDSLKPYKRRISTVTDDDATSISLATPTVDASISLATPTVDASISLTTPTVDSSISLTMPTVDSSISLTTPTVDAPSTVPYCIIDAEDITINMADSPKRGGGGDGGGGGSSGDEETKSTCETNA